nr:MAG TPA: hypothetical protein [Caudoviricetes sp.]
MMDSAAVAAVSPTDAHSSQSKDRLWIAYSRFRAVSVYSARFCGTAFTIFSMLHFPFMVGIMRVGRRRFPSPRPVDLALDHIVDRFCNCCQPGQDFNNCFGDLDFVRGLFLTPHRYHLPSMAIL